MNKSDLRQVFDRTGGVCHFCGYQLDFKKRGRGGGAKGCAMCHLATGKSIMCQKSRGGPKSAVNSWRLALRVTDFVGIVPVGIPEQRCSLASSRAS